MANAPMGDQAIFIHAELQASVRRSFYGYAEPETRSSRFLQPSRSVAGDFNRRRLRPFLCTRRTQCTGRASPGTAIFDRIEWESPSTDAAIVNALFSRRTDAFVWTAHPEHHGGGTERVSRRGGLLRAEVDAKDFHACDPAGGVRSERRAPLSATGTTIDRDARSN